MGRRTAVLYNLDTLPFTRRSSPHLKKNMFDMQLWVILFMQVMANPPRLRHSRRDRSLVTQGCWRPLTHYCLQPVISRNRDTREGGGGERDMDALARDCVPGMTRRRNVLQRRGAGGGLALARIPTSSRRDSTCMWPSLRKEGIPCSYPIRRLVSRYSAGRDMYLLYTGPRGPG